MNTNDSASTSDEEEYQEYDDPNDCIEDDNQTKGRSKLSTTTGCAAEDTFINTVYITYMSSFHSKCLFFFLHLSTSLKHI
jgi:hypothetical protein